MLFRVFPRLFFKFPNPFRLFLFHHHKPIAISSIFSFLLYTQYKSQAKSAPRFISSSESSGLTIFSKSTNQPLSSGFFLTKDGVFLTILNVFPSQSPQQINSSLYYVKIWTNPSIVYPLMIDYILPEENLAFGHIITTEETRFSSLQNIDFSNISNPEMGNKAYLFSKSQSSENIIETGYILEKSFESLINIHHPDTVIYGSAIMNKEGKILGMLQPPHELNNERSSRMMDINFLKPICEQYLEKKEVKKAYLGLSVKNSNIGLTVIKVNSGGPANIAGMKLGDVIIEVNGRKIETSGEFIRMMSYGKDEKIRLKVLRNGILCDIDLTSG